MDRVGRDSLPVLENLFQLYHYDFSDIVGSDVGDDGRFAWRPLAEYWDGERHQVFLFRVNGALAGFGIVRRGSRLTGDEEAWDMDQFFVLRRYRRQGIGARAATRLFQQFPGPWEVRQIVANTGAIEFWRRAIGEFAGDGAWTEIEVETDGVRRCLQRFTSGGASIAGGA